MGRLGKQAYRDRDEFVRGLHSSVGRWNHEIDALVARKDTIEASARADLDARLDDLRSQRDRAMNRLSVFQTAGEHAWQGVRSGLEFAWEAVSQAIASAKARFN